VALLALTVILAGAGEVLGQTRRAARPADDPNRVHKATRLGGATTRLTPPMKDVAALRRTFNSKTRSGQRAQKLVSGVLDAAGLTGITPQVLAALTEGKVETTSFPVGGTMQWMGYRKAGRPAILRNVEWAGRRPFDAFTFTVEDGVKNYNFVVPKPCGNLALANVTEKPLPTCVNMAVTRDCDAKTMTFTGSGGAVTAGEVTKISMLRDGTKVAELKPEDNFKLTTPIQPGRYTFMAMDKYGREFATCERELVVEACAAPPPPPPPPPTTCNVVVTATKAKGGFDLNIDGSGSGGGPSPAAKAVVQIIGPDGQPVAFTHGGKSQTQVEIGPPFKETFLVPKPKPGTYTVRGNATPVNPKAEPKTCEATVVIPEYDKVDFFADGLFGKQRRQYEVAASEGSSVTVTPGFCDPTLGVRAGALFWLKDERVSLAPAAGLAFMFGDLEDFDFSPNEYNNVSFFLEGAVNFHFSPRGAFIGTGIDWWDVFDGDHDTGAWLINFGAPIKATDKGELFFIGEGRLFFDAPDGIDNNYLVWGGLRYIFR
jgi:hypothetical protein